LVILAAAHKMHLRGHRHRREAPARLSTSTVPELRQSRNFCRIETDVTSPDRQRHQRQSVVAYHNVGSDRIGGGGKGHFISLCSATMVSARAPRYNHFNKQFRKFIVFNGLSYLF
jgi:hypothetical protein